MLHGVIEVKPLKNHRLHVRFDDGVEGTEGTGAAADVDNPTDVEGPAAAEEEDGDGY